MLNLKRKARQYNKHRLDGEPKMTLAEYRIWMTSSVLSGLRTFRKPKVDKITKARLMAIIDEDRENEDFPTCREQQCGTCWFRIFHKSDMSHVDICSLGRDMDSLKACPEWVTPEEMK